MLFFFELFLFVLVMLTLALGEFVSRGLALILWLVATAFALGGYALARQSLTSVLAGGSPDGSTDGVPSGVAHPGEGPSKHPTDSAPPVQPRGEPTPLDEKWARTLLYNWRRANVLLILGAVAVGGWYWLAG